MNTAILFSTLFADTTNTLPISPISCKGDGCLSYLFPGSMNLIAPWPWRVPGFFDADVLIVHGVQGIQIDYWSLDSTDHLDSSDCKVYGAIDAAVMLCIASSTLDRSELIAGLKSFLNRLISRVERLSLYYCRRKSMFEQSIVDRSHRLVNVNGSFRAHFRYCIRH